jgi:hypothetical protein
MDMSKFQHFLSNSSAQAKSYPPVPQPLPVSAPVPGAYGGQGSIYPQFGGGPGPAGSMQYAPPMQPLQSPPVQTFSALQAPAPAKPASIYPVFEKPAGPAPPPVQAQPSYKAPSPIDKMAESRPLVYSAPSKAYASDDMILMLRNIAMLFIEFFEKIQIQDQSDDQIKLITGFLAYRKGYQLLDKLLRCLRGGTDPSSIVGLTSTNWEAFRSSGLDTYLAMISKDHTTVSSEFRLFFNQNKPMLMRKFTNEYQKLLSDDITQDFDDILIKVLSICKGQYAEKAKRSEGDWASLYFKIAIDSFALTCYKEIVILNFDFSSYYSRMERMKTEDFQKVLLLPDVQSFIRYFQ